MTRRKASGRVSWRREWWGAALLALSSAAATGGCADHVQGGVVTCPCDTGVCCTSGVCAANENACEQATQALSSDAVGRWTGYIENYALQSGSGALDLTLDLGNDGLLSGHLIVGAGTPPPVDGTVGWPAAHDNLILDQNVKHPPLVDGFAYHLTNVRWTALRLQFEVALGEPWGPWCALQQVYVWSPEEAACNPNGTGYLDADHCVVVEASGEQMPRDCERIALCEPSVGSCACTPASCGAGARFGLAFDIALHDNQGDGSFDGSDHAPQGNFAFVLSRNVRLIRASN